VPYIKKEDRNRINQVSSADYALPMLKINYEQIDTAGELQYAMAIMFKSYIERKGLNYQHCNDVMGALAGAQMEFYRRHVAEYEDQKIESNGDV